MPTKIAGKTVTRGGVGDEGENGGRRGGKISTACTTKEKKLIITGLVLFSVILKCQISCFHQKK